MISRTQTLNILILWLAGLGVAPANPLQLRQMDHATWTAREGGPIDVYQFAQDRDGSLWVLSGSGLYDFDGVKFSAFSPRSPKATASLDFIKSLFVDDHGCLWLGSEIRGIAQTCGRQVTRVFDESDGLPGGQVKQILQSPDGSILAIARDHLVQLRDGRWSNYGTSAGYPNEAVSSAFFDHSGRLFVMANMAIWLQNSGRENFRMLPTAGGLWGMFAERPDGSVWVITNLPNRKPAYIERLPLDTDPQAPPQRIIIDASGFIADDHGALWIAGDKGVARANFGLHASPAAAGVQAGNQGLDVYTHVEGLTSDAVSTIFQDRSGNLWVGTAAGIDRLRNTPLVRFVDRTLPFNPQLTVCPSGEVWAGSYQTTPFSVRRGATTDHGTTRNSVAIFCDRAGVVWLSDRMALFRYQGGDVRAITPPPGIEPWLLRKVEGKNEHALFVAITRHGLWTYRDGTWAPFAAPGFPDITPISLHEDSQGRLWAGFIDSRIAVLKDGVGQTYGSGTGSPLGEVQVFCESRVGLLAGGTNGLAVFKGDHFDSLLLENSNAARGVSGLLEAANGDLWLNGLHGIERIPSEEVTKAATVPGYRMRSETLHEAGMTGPSTQLVGLPSAVADLEGRFWFSTATGLFSLDPVAAIRNPELPMLGRLSLSVDAKEMTSGAKIPHGEHTIRIGYLGVYLAAPEKVTYKYKLEGIDTDWQDVGNRTEAVYTGLGPGDYRFRVVASSGYGRWTPEDDSIRFSMRPAFFQTVWFALACVLVTLILFWGLVRLRTHRLAHEIRRRAEERADERIRIARDLHDTLLQGVQGLMLRFHAAAQEVSADGLARGHLDGALKAADQVLVEARDRVSRLRADEPTNIDLAARFRAIGEDLNYENTVQFNVAVQGEPAVLSAPMLDEMYFIGREALTNAFRHSDASIITVTINYAWSGVTFTFADDGCGFHSDVPVAGQPRHHWGMSGMMERAHRIGAEFECRTIPGSGTSILISVPLRSPVARAVRFWIPRFLR